MTVVQIGLHSSTAYMQEVPECLLHACLFLDPAPPSPLEDQPDQPHLIEQRGRKE